MIVDGRDLDIYFWNGAGTRYDVYSNTNVMSANTWYSIEVETNQATSGHGEVWLNGTLSAPSMATYPRLRVMAN